MRFNTYQLNSVIKRDGTKTDFQSKKIVTAIEKAALACDVDIPKFQIKAMVEDICRKLSVIHIHTEPSIEQIQDSVEEELFSKGYFRVLRAFITYREKHKLIRSDRDSTINAVRSVAEYVNLNDWRVNANANQGYSLGGLILNSSGKITANYWLKHVYSEEVGKAHLEADYHIHDLDMLSGYCAGWSLRVLLNEGFNGVNNKTESDPPRHFMSALSQIVNFLGTLQNEWAGAQAFSSFDTYMAPFVYKDKLSYDQVKQNMQQFIFNLNIPSRWGSQTPFTNLTMDWTVPSDIKDQIPRCDNEALLRDEPEKTYGEFQHEMNMINQAFLEVMSEGDAKGRVFTFPIPTYNITEEFDWDSENVELLFEVTAKYGLPYFQNFIGSQYTYDNRGRKVHNDDAYTPGAVRSMCCRLQLDLNELLKRGNGLFGSAEMTGSIGVVTINAARLGYKCKGEYAQLITELKHLMNLAKESLEVKRKIILQNMDNGLYPYTRRYLGHLRNHFSTIGINGINEMVRNFTQDKDDLTTEAGKQLALEVLDTMRSIIVEYQNESGNLYNLEATPAEGTTYRFAKEDKKRFPDILQAGFGEHIYYTNSSQIPVGTTDDPFEALELQDEIQCKYNGGTVLHLYMGERLTTSEACKQLVKTVISTYRLPYITVTPTFSICSKHGYLRGEQEFCPHCDEAIIQKHKTTFDELVRQHQSERTKCEIWTRVMGYYRPVSQFNIGKKGEYQERQYFTQDQSLKHCESVDRLHV